MLEFFSYHKPFRAGEQRMDFVTFSVYISVQINFFQMLATVVGIIHHHFCQEWVWSLIHKEDVRNSLFQEKSRFEVEYARSPKIYTYLITRMFRHSVAAIPVADSEIQEQ